MFSAQFESIAFHSSALKRVGATDVVVVATCIIFPDTDADGNRDGAAGTCADATDCETGVIPAVGAFFDAAF